MTDPNILLAAFNSSPFPMMLLQHGKDGFTIKAGNKALFDGIGQCEESVIGKNIVRLFHQIEMEQWAGTNYLEASLDKVMTSAKPDTMPVIQYSKDGGSALSTRYFQCSNTPLLDAEGMVTAILFIATEVTQRFAASMELKKIRRRLVSAQKIANVGYWEYNLVSDELFWSDELFNILEISKSTVDPVPGLYFSAIHPDDRPKYFAARSRALSGEQEMDIELRLVFPGGKIKWVHQAGKVRKDYKGFPVAFEGVIKNITVSKLLKLSLEESNLRYRYVSKAAFDTIYDWDIINQKYHWSEGFQENFGHAGDKIETKNFWLSRVHPADIERVKSANRKALEGKDTGCLNEYRFMKGDGKYAYVVDRASIIRDHNGKAIRMIGAIQDVTEKKNLQTLLDKANKLAKIGSWEIDVKSNTVFWSDITKQIREVPHDYTPTLENGTSYFIEQEGVESIRSKVEKAIKNGTPWQQDYQIYTHKGNKKWIRTIGEPEIINGRCRKIYGSFQDIDEQKKAALEISRLYEEKNIILESIGDAFFRIEHDWTVTYWNKEAEKLLHTSREEAINKKFWKTFPQSVDSISYKKYHESLETGAKVQFEEYNPVLNKWYDISAFPYEKGLSVFFRDVTERKLSQIKLQESEMRYSELFRINPHPIWVFDANTLAFTQVNKAAMELYGFTEQEFLSMTILDIRPREDEQFIRDKIRNHNSGDGYASGVYRHLTKDGRSIIVEVKSKLIVINKGLHRLAIITDITERLDTEKKISRTILRTQENERFELGAELHDNVCQILASTYITMGVLAKSVSEPGTELFNKCRAYIHLATQEIRSLSHRLAPSMLANAPLKEAIQKLASDINVEKKYHLTIYYDELLNDIEMNQDLKLNLYRILQEQLRNIAKYARCKNIAIDVLRFDQKIKMRIEDDGVGFDLNNVNSGIGLSNMKRRTELFEGTFEINSAPGNGCEVIIELPLKEQPTD